MNVSDWLSTLDNMGFLTFRMLVSVLWQSSIILGAVCMLAYMLRLCKESVRHTIWVAAIFVIPLIPMLTLGMSKIGSPQTEISVMPVYSDPHTRFFQSQLKHRSELKLRLPQEHKPFRLKRDETHIHNISPSAQTSLSANDREANQGIIRLSISDYIWALVFMGYAAIVMFLLLWDIIGRLCIRNWIMYGGAVTDSNVIEIFQDVKEHLGLSKEFIIIENEHVSAPITFRTLRPVVILPAGLVKTLSETELRAVAFHELSHIKRNDVFIFSAMSLVRAVFFFHPLVWLATSQVACLAEIACDNTVLDNTKKPVSYAGLLTRLAENLTGKKLSTEFAAGIMLTKSTFYRRIEAILSHRKNRFGKLSHAATIGIMTVAAMSLVAALVFPLGDAKKTGEELTISGKVVFESKPVSGAIIYVNEQWNKLAVKVAKTDREGTFTFNIPRTKLIGPNTSMPAVIAFKKQYSIGWVKLKSEWGITDLTIKLHNPETIAGTVLNCNGEPVKGAKVSIRGLSTSQYGGLVEYDYSAFDNRSVVAGHDVKTDKNGRFVMHNVPEGIDIGIAVSKKGYAELYRKSIPAGMCELDIILHPEGSIEGKITYGDTNKPARNIGVRIEKVTGRNECVYWTETTTDLNGYYKVKNMSPGSYNVFLRDQLSGWTASAKTRINVEEGKTSRGIDLTLIRGGFITGKVVDKDTKEPLKGQLIRFTDSSHPQRRTRNFTYTNMVHTDENGYYYFRTAPGKVTISTTGSDGYEICYACKTIDSHTYETVNYTDFQLKKAITVTGKVVSTHGESVTGLQVKILQENLLCGGYAGLNDFVTTDADGRFTIEGLKECDFLELMVYNSRLNFSKTISFEVRSVIEEEIL